MELPVPIGGTLADKYRIERVLGAGAMGIVVAVLHIDLGERRAIKFMRSSMLERPEYVERFLREARAAAQLKSEHVARVLDTGRLDGGAPYIVFEYLEGDDLKTVLEARGQLPLHEAARCVIDACEALAEAHAAGIVHRDLKPGNLFLARAANGGVSIKVLDFGVAKISPFGEMAGGVMTVSQEIIGTPMYMAPEQIRGLRNTDARADIWSLGVILYRAVTGRMPFHGESFADVGQNVLRMQPPPPSRLRGGLPASLDAVILRCLEKEPERRFSTAAELAAALAPFTVAAPAAPPAAFTLGQGQAWSARGVAAPRDAPFHKAPPPDAAGLAAAAAPGGIAQGAAAPSPGAQGAAGLAVAQRAAGRKAAPPPKPRAWLALLGVSTGLLLLAIALLALIRGSRRAAPEPGGTADGPAPSAAASDAHAEGSAPGATSAAESAPAAPLALGGLPAPPVGAAAPTDAVGEAQPASSAAPAASSAAAAASSSADALTGKPASPRLAPKRKRVKDAFGDERE
ncbi:serine/threonine-protein kinase [Sorangium sp. So ce1000]|uniref:serine/threonine-protein kinase n=1 Tax=Sorangium sp. So ce1000 TaxID=3133325 RepID=UPI003F613ED5